MTDLSTDLRERWTPTPRQVERAEARMRATGETEVYSAQILTRKQEHVWTADVVVLRAPGKLVLGTREAAMRVAEQAAAAWTADTGESATGSWARHTPGEQWAVWETAARAATPEREALYARVAAEQAAAKEA